jgi:fluoride exporter
MSLLVFIGIGLLGGVGAVGRFLLDGSVSGRAGRDFPYGTLAVNILGAFALGLLVGGVLDTNALRLAGTGLVGGFTTFSTWTLESHRLGEDGEMRLGVVNFAVSLVLGVGVAWAGRHLGAAL